MRWGISGDGDSRRRRSFYAGGGAAAAAAAAKARRSFFLLLQQQRSPFYASPLVPLKNTAAMMTMRQVAVSYRKVSVCLYMVGSGVWSPALSYSYMPLSISPSAESGTAPLSSRPASTIGRIDHFDRRAGAADDAEVRPGPRPAASAAPLGRKSSPTRPSGLGPPRPRCVLRVS